MHPVQQYPSEPLKTEISRIPLPMPHDLALELSSHVEQFCTTWIMCDEPDQQMGPWQMQREFRKAKRAKVKGYPMGSGSTTYGTVTRRCSSPLAWTSR